MISIAYFDWRSSGPFCWVLLKTKLFIKWNGNFFIYRLNEDCYLYYSWVLVRAGFFVSWLRFQFSVIRLFRWMHEIREMFNFVIWEEERKKVLFFRSAIWFIWSLKRERKILGGGFVRLEKTQKFSVCNCNEPKITQITLFDWDSKTRKNGKVVDRRPTGIRTKIFILDNYWIGLMYYECLM